MNFLSKAAFVSCALFAAAQVPGEGEDVVTITADNYRDEIVGYDGLILMEIYAPWCGHCKNLAPEWAKAATALKGKVKLAALDATAHEELGKMFGAQGYPTLVTFPYGEKEDDEGIIIGKYNGGRVADDIIDFASQELDKVGIDITEIAELVDQESLDVCLAKKYCVVAMLPHIVDTGASGRNEYLDIIKSLGKTMGRSNPTGYIWTQSGNQFEMEEAFQSQSYPGLLVINKDRSRYVNHRGSFTVQSLSKTIRSLQTGRLSADTYKSFPAIEKVDPWDGKDYVYPEEDDL